MSIQNWAFRPRLSLIRGGCQDTLRENLHDPAQAFLGRQLVRLHELIVRPQARTPAPVRLDVVPLVSHAWEASLARSEAVNPANWNVASRTVPLNTQRSRPSRNSSSVAA